MGRDSMCVGKLRASSQVLWRIRCCGRFVGSTRKGQGSNPPAILATSRVRLDDDASRCCDDCCGAPYLGCATANLASRLSSALLLRCRSMRLSRCLSSLVSGGSGLRGLAWRRSYGGIVVGRVLKGMSCSAVRPERHVDPVAFGYGSSRVAWAQSRAGPLRVRMSERGVVNARSRRGNLACRESEPLRQAWVAQAWRTQWPWWSGPR